MMQARRISYVILMLLEVTVAATAQNVQQSIGAHEGAVWATAFSPNGQWLATSGDDGAIQLRETAEWKIARTLTGHEGSVRAVGFSSDSALLASTGADGTVRIWSVESGEVVRVMQDSKPTFFPCFSQDSKLLVTGSEDAAARVWDLGSGEVLHLLGGHTDRAWMAALSPDGATVCTGSRDGTARLFDLATGDFLRELLHGPAAGTAAAFSPDGRELATGGADATLIVWDVASGELIRAVDGHSAAIVQLAYSPDGGTLATVTGDGILRLWDAKTRLFLRGLRGVGGLSLAFAPSGGLLAAGRSDGTVDIVDWRRALAIRESAVDLIPERERLGLAPRGQGARNTCSVFTTTHLLEQVLAERAGTGIQLSPEYLNWACNKVTGNETVDTGQFFHNLLEAFEHDGVCYETEMPYRATFEPDYAPSDEAKQTAATVRDLGLKIHWINPWLPQSGLTDEHMAEVKRVLASGTSVAAGAGHSTLLVGYIDDPEEPGGGSFLVVDSGGPGHYIETSYAFVQEHVGDVFWVE